MNNRTRSHPGPLARALRTLLLATAVWSLPGHTYAQAPQYSVTILANVSANTYGHSEGINASGQVAGLSITTPDSIESAVIWTGTSPTLLGGLGGSDSIAFGINTFGQVTGSSYLTGDSESHAVRWTNGIPQDTVL